MTREEMYAARFGKKPRTAKLRARKLPRREKRVNEDKTHEPLTKSQEIREQQVEHLCFVIEHGLNLEDLEEFILRDD